MTIIINDSCSRYLSDAPEHEAEVKAFIKAEIDKGVWTNETPYRAVESGETIDSGMLKDLFNLK